MDESSKQNRIKQIQYKLNNQSIQWRQNSKTMRFAYIQNLVWETWNKIQRKLLNSHPNKNFRISSLTWIQVIFVENFRKRKERFLKDNG